MGSAIGDESVDERWCPSCAGYTRQACIDSGHERDSAWDAQECLVCHWQYFGFTGKWEPPTDVSQGSK